jgi:hypothetical protein
MAISEKILILFRSPVNWEMAYISVFMIELDGCMVAAHGHVVFKLG